MTKVQVIPGKPVELPSGEFVSTAEYARHDLDLHMTSPDGQEIIIEGYYAQDPQPDIITADGARLSPSLIDTFVPAQHAGQYAEAGSGGVSDVSAAGQITELVGTATITRADGTKAPVSVGTPIYPGDVIETSADGAVNILFADNTTFAISESGRLAVNEFNYDSAAKSGSTFFSILQGVFVYTSGLIGKGDPNNVQIETPVGSIGIRGTIVAGDINPAGEESKITIVQGAIVVTNGAGTISLDNNLETAGFSSYQQPPQDMGTISTQSFNSYYTPVSAVSPGTFTGVADGTFVRHDAELRAKEAASQPDAQKSDAPADAPSEAPPASEGQQAAPSEGEAPQQQQAVPPAGDAVQPPPTVIQQPIIFTPPPPPPGSDFGSGTVTGFTGDAPPPPAGATGPAPIGANPPPPPPGSVPPGTVTTSPPPPPELRFAFGPAYTQGTATLVDDGIPLFGIGPVAWNSGTVIGHAVLNNFVGTRTYELAYDDGNGTTGTVATSADISGDIFTANTVTTGDPYDTIIATGPLFHFDVATGTLSLNSVHSASIPANSEFEFTLVAKDAGGNVVDTHNFVVLMDQHTGPVFVGTAGNDGDVTAMTGGITTAMSNVAILAGAGDDMITSTSVNAEVFGQAGNDTLVVTNQNFGIFEGGAGIDRLVLGNGLVYDFSNAGTDAKGIEVIALGGGTDASDVHLSIQDIFEMTDANHTLTIKSLSANTISRLFIDTDAFHTITGTPHYETNPGGVGNAVGTGNVTMTGTVNGATVTLIVEQGASTDGVVITNV